MNKVIVITGPTAVGKTKLSIELAKRYNGEIINADAVQVYKGLDIGSAKVTEEEKEDIPHHLFDIKEVDEEYTIYHYQKDCRKLIKEVQGRGKTPILVGGTGLYIKAALYDYKLTEEKETNTYDNLTDEELYNKLLEEKGFTYAITRIASPGKSEHQTGLALDFCIYKDGKCYIEHDVEDKIETKWIHQNSHRYGFIIRYPEGKEDITKYSYEPWHLRYVGNIASSIYNNNLTLEEYKDKESIK